MKQLTISLLAMICWSAAMAQYSKPYEITYRADKKSYLICNRGDGSVIEIDSTFSSKKVVTGLTDPRDLRYAKIGANEGLVILDENKLKLFDASYASVVDINIGVATEAESMDFDISNPDYFYITDVKGGKVIEGKVGPPPFYLPTFRVLVDTGLIRPSGIFIDSKNRMLVVSDDTGAVIREVNKSTGAHKVLMNSGLDSLKRIVEDKEGNYFVTNCGDSYQYRIDHSMKNKVKLSGFNKPCGMYLNAPMDWLMTCCMNCNKLEIQKLHWFEPVGNLAACTGDSLKVNISPQYRGVGTFYSNNRFVIELSGKGGDFSKAIDLGYTEDDENPSDIYIHLPKRNFDTGLEYRIRSTNPRHYSTARSFNAWNTPLATIYGADSVDLCENSTLQLGGSGAANATYMWEPGHLVSDSNASDPVFEADNSGKFKIYLSTVDSITACADRDSLYLNVNENIELGSLKRVLRACRGDSTEIGLSASPYKFKWSPMLGLTSDSVSGPIWDAQVDTLYRISLTDPRSGCSGADSVRVMVDEHPDLSTLKDSFSTCTGDSVVLQTGIDTSYEVTWTPGILLSDSRSSEPTYYGQGRGEDVLELTAENKALCQSKTTVSIMVIPLPELPDAEATRVSMRELRLRLGSTDQDSVQVWAGSTALGDMEYLQMLSVTDSMVSVDSAMQYFAIRAESENGCQSYGDTLHAPYVPTGSIHELYRLLEIQPQPSRGLLWINLTGNVGIDHVLISDLTGRRTMAFAELESTDGTYQLDLRTLPDGVYILEASYGHGLTARKKIILSK